MPGPGYAPAEGRRAPAGRRQREVQPCRARAAWHVPAAEEAWRAVGEEEAWHAAAAPSRAYSAALQRW